MPSSRRAVVAALLILLSAAAPFAGDWCAESCDAAHAAAAVPSCHHQNTATVRMTAAPQRCGHDHAQLAAASSLPAATAHAAAADLIVELPAFLPRLESIGATPFAAVNSPPLLPPNPLGSLLRV